MSHSKLYTKTSPAKPPTDFLGTTLQVAGAATGITVLIYFVGASTEWIRFAVLGYSPDIAIAHQSQTSFVALGVQGALVVAGLSLTSLGIVALARVVISRSSALREPGHRWRRNFFIAGGSLLVIAMAINWRLVSIVIVVMASIFVEPSLRRGRWYDLRNLEPWPAVRLGLVAAVAAVLWQIGGFVHAQGVFVKPAIHTVGSAQECKGNRSWDTQSDRRKAIPYFGETSTHIYVDRLLCWTTHDTGGYAYTFERSGTITELKRAGYRLAFPGGSDGLRVHAKRPWVSVGYLLWNAADQLG